MCSIANDDIDVGRPVTESAFVKESMLEKARELFERMPLTRLGAHSTPQASKVLKTASTWLGIYPPAIITDDKRSALICVTEFIANGTLKHLGFDAIYLTPVSRSGGLSTLSTDGNFDPISLDEIDPAVGTLADYRRRLLPFAPVVRHVVPRDGALNDDSGRARRCGRVG